MPALVIRCSSTRSTPHTSRLVSLRQQYNSSTILSNRHYRQCTAVLYIRCSSTRSTPHTSRLVSLQQYKCSTTVSHRQYRQYKHKYICSTVVSYRQYVCELQAVQQ
jgi:hypothetical protein